MEINYIVLLLLAISVVMGVLVVYTWRRRYMLNSVSIAGLLLSIAIWTFAASLELVAIDIHDKRLFTVFCYIGIVTLPVFFFFFASEYTNTQIPKLKVARIAAWVLPTITFVIVATNRYHGLFYRSSELRYIGSFAYNHIEYGFWWWIHVTYSYSLIIAGIVLFFLAIPGSVSRQRGQIFVLLIASIIPFVGNVAYLLGFKPFGFVDITPITFAVTGTLFFRGLYHKKMNFRPIALETLFNSMPDGILVLDNSNQLTEANATARNIFCKNPNDYLPEKVIELLVNPLKLTQKQEISTEFDISGNTFSIQVKPIVDYRSKSLGKIVILRNVSEKLRTQKELFAAQNRLALATKVAGIDPWENNFSTGQSVGGEQIYIELGYSVAEVPRTLEQIFSIIHPDDLPEVKSKLISHLNGKTNFYTADFRMRNKWGEYRWIANYGMVSERDEEGKAVRMVGLSMNINERKKDEERIKKQNEELVKTNAEKDKFFSIIAHDLKGPFQGFIGLTELLTEQGVKMKPDELMDLTKTLQDTAKNIYELLENLLGWAMIKRGRKVFKPEKILLLPVVQSVIELLKPQINAKNHRVAVNVISETELLADKESVRTVFRNIISNAIKFTPNGGTITIAQNGVDKGFLVVSIADSGIGMPTEIRENLFNVSAKISRMGTNNEPSTGLGLILCRELIEKHGGRIWVESEAEKGSVFWFTIPVAV